MKAKATANGRGVLGVVAASAALATAAIAALGASCASTEMTNTWVSPTKGAPLSKVAVIALAKDPGMRRMAEDAAASQMPDAQAVPSYQVLGDTDLRNRQEVESKLRAAGFNGALVMRLAGVSEQVTPVAAPYETFGGYYDWAGNMVYAPGYLQTDTVVHVVSNLYSLNDGKLVWSGTSQTFNPASSREVIDGVSKAVAKSMEREHVIL
jgi:hypothetical protein